MPAVSFVGVSVFITGSSFIRDCCVGCLELCGVEGMDTGLETGVVQGEDGGRVQMAGGLGADHGWKCYTTSQVTVGPRGRVRPIKLLSAFYALAEEHY